LAGQQMKILVVDDDPVHVELISELLASQNHLVVSALDGGAAIELLDHGTVDLIISDIEMPRMNGTTFHSHLQQLQQAKDIPFVFLTGLDNPISLPYFKDNPSVPIVKKSDIRGLLHMVAERTLEFEHQRFS
jgi:CheY-like chemotaxis protein